MPNLIPVMPELFLLGMTCVILVVDLFLTDRQRLITYWMTLGTLAGTALLSWQILDAPRELIFSGMFISDGMAQALKLVACIGTALVFIYSRDYLQERGLLKGEFFTLGLFALLGILIITSAQNFLPLYLGLELLSLSLYALVAFDRDSPVAAEAAMKYFVLGAIASGMLLYGMSILYGLTGSLDVVAVSERVAELDRLNVGLILGLSFVIVGLCFKFGAVPFHMWIPDVYHGAPTPVTLYVGSVPKLAAFALFMRLLVDGLAPLHADWRDMLIILSVLSMAIGSFVAIAQTNIKRMLAYSTIAHVGFIFLGILAGTAEGYTAAMYYTVVYVLMALAAFGMVLLLSRKGFEADRLDDFKGLNQRHPWYAMLMLFAMFSMAGVPPFVGFFAKLEVLAAALHVGLDWLVVLAVIFSVISAFYYLRVVKLMYFDNPEETAPITAGAGMRLALSANGLALLLLGIFPGALLALCLRVLGG